MVVLPAPFGPKQRDAPTFADHEIDPVDRTVAPVVLHETARFQHNGFGHARNVPRSAG